MYGLEHDTGDLDRPVDEILADAGIDDERPDFEHGLSMLGAHVQRCWNAARMAKDRHTRTLLSCLRQRNGDYEPEILQEIRNQGGSEIYMMLSQVKCRATESWLMDMLFPPGERPYAVDPTPVPDLEPQVHQRVEQRVIGEVQEAIMLGIEVDPNRIQERIENVEGQVIDMLETVAQQRAEAMERRINDVVDEGGWQDELEAFIGDFVTYPAAFFKGPVRIQKRRLHWQEDDFGQAHPVAEKEPVRVFKRVSPFDLFPAPDAHDLSDGYLFELIRYRRKSLYDLIGLPGYDEEAIRRVIQEYGDSGHKIRTTHDSEQDRLEGRDHEEWSNDTVIEALNFWGEVRGQWLIEWGMPEALIPDPDDDYECNVVMIGEHIIRAALNPHPLGRRPYQSACLERVNGQIWGKGVTQIISDLQDMCNSAARSLVNNMAFASGPMADVQIDRLAEGETVGDWYPWRTIQSTESKSGTTTRPAVQFFQPQSNAEQLMQVYSFFSSLADEYSGIPPYATGASQRGGAAETATGLGMLQDNAARGIKRGIKNIDTFVIRPSIKAIFEDIMLYDDAPEAKGDLRIVARASTALANRERQAIRRNELFQMTNNPVDLEIMGLEGRLKQLEEMFQMYDIDPTEILPSRDDMRKRMMQAQMAQQQQMALGGEVNQAGQEQGGPQPEQRMAGG